MEQTYRESEEDEKMFVKNFVKQKKKKRKSLNIVVPFTNVSEGSLRKEGSRREKRELDPKRVSTTTLQTETAKNKTIFFFFFFFAKNDNVENKRLQSSVDQFLGQFFGVS